MGTAALAGALISAAVAGTAAIAKGVQAKKARKERSVKQNELQEQMAATKGNYQAYRTEAKHDRGQAMHASMEMYEPVWAQMEEMYPGWKRPDFEGAMAMNESRADPDATGPSRPLNTSEGKPPEPLAPQHTMSTSGSASREDIQASRGSSTAPMSTSGSSSGANRGSGPGPMSTTGNKPGGVGGH